MFYKTLFVRGSKNILGIATICALLLAILIYEIFPYIEFYFRMKKTLYKPDYVELFIYETEERIKITDLEDHLNIWESIDLLYREKAESYHRDELIAYLGFPIDIEGELFEWPIYIHKDGVIIWGIPPRSNRFFYMPKLRDETLRLIEKYSTKNQNRSRSEKSPN